MRRPSHLALPEGEVHLWWSDPGETDDPDLDERARRVLGGEEVARMERMRFEKGRRLFLVSHLLVRTALSHYSDRNPADWRFVRGAHGKPSLAPEMGQPPLKFNLAHTAGLAVVGVTRDAEIGVDVERKDRSVKARELMDRFFAPEEAAELGVLPPDMLRDRFFLTWTLKEAYLKALGLGLAQPLGSFALRLDSPERPGGVRPSGAVPLRIRFSGLDLPASFGPRFVLVAPRLPFVAALCVFSDRPGDLSVRCCGPAPPGDAAPLPCEAVGLSDGIGLSSPAAWPGPVAS